MKKRRKKEPKESYNLQPFRRAVLRGLGVVLPPLLTIVILLWIANSVQKFVLTPVEWCSRQVVVAWHQSQTDSDEIQFAYDQKQKEDEEDRKKQSVSNDREPTESSETEVQRTLRKMSQQLEAMERKLGINSSIQPTPGISVTDIRFEFKSSDDEESVSYVRLENGEWIPAWVHAEVQEHVAASGVAMENRSAKGYYEHYVEHKVLRKERVIPVFFAGFILLMYLLGKFLAAGVGRILWNSMESIITQLPIIRTVYNSVKQVTDFFFGESDIDFQRVVAVEYPRKGCWSVGFVTGESLMTIRGAAQEPVVSVLMPTSPVPGTGFTISVRKSETIDLDIPIDQALQFVVSCGVVIPEDQVADDEVRARIEAAARGDSRYVPEAKALPGA